MARAQPNLWGEARGLARELAHKPTPDVVRRINGQFPDFVPRILGTLSVEQQTRYGLSMNDRGRLVLAAAIGDGMHPAPTPEHVTVSPAEIAKALNKARPVVVPAISKEPPLYVIGYGKPVAADDAPKAWEHASATTDRIAVMRQALSIRTAEVSSIAHGGEYTQVHSNGDQSVVARHAGKLLHGLSAPAPHSDRIQWERRDEASDACYSLQQLSIGDGEAEHVPVLVQSQPHGLAVETGARLGQFGNDDVRYRSPGRVFAVSSDTIFAIDPDLASELADGMSLTADTPLALHGDEATVAADFIATEDPTVLAPAYTNFVVDQRLTTT